MAENPFVERAARRIDRHLEQHGSRPAWSDHLPLVRALLLELRVPSPPMIDIGARTLDGLQPTPEAMAEAIWQRMIDIALDEAN